MNNEIIGYERIDKFNPEKLEKLQEHYAAILELLGEDVTREGLEKTPLRVAKSMQFLTQGYTMDPKEILLSAKFKEDYRQMVVVKDIELFSLCEHHMIPFIGKAHVAYIPNGYITGCGYRVAYNRHMHFCPYCGKRISNLSNMVLDAEKEENNGHKTHMR